MKLELIGGLLFVIGWGLMCAELGISPNSKYSGICIIPGVVLMFGVIFTGLLL